ncbi:MGA2 (YIR033W) and SPT23 (YKL020C) [Zygosaccharomyces parabailii]|uniref:ZYBA0S06-07272g1_1 n=1 Tax=Zygosaccharomyces bailii (strain CLIB 213 / ATCC 58445 / CBS 680 / BCRC 21525 / NBRC 1098 / NCYC 1416 / NRRL Y-2227) TaxID=1333698 RepID=A0A8J2X9F8_ZYGB2|nr:MGA2 (YIR033W) and SPT23 (YKL020C) [Zygosaccharomyces parabailii]CDF90382.1 ZYBA0S06-07272g1_1 [Zygosaccharomyces bailii CLIB 213]
MISETKSEALFPSQNKKERGGEQQEQQQEKAEEEEVEVNMLESDLLEEFMFNHGDGDDKMDDEDSIFNTFVNTETLDGSGMTHDRVFGSGDDRRNNEDHSPGASTAKQETTVLQQEEKPPSPALNSSGYEKHCQELVENSLVFGRTEPLHTVYVNPLDYLHIEESTLPYQLQVLGLPDVSRVENQIKLEFRISPAMKQCIVHLPTDCIARHKFYLEKDITSYPQEFQDQLLYAEAFLLCSSNDKTTYVCTRCVKREHRRASRRKSGLSDNMLWCNNENRRAIIFNNRQVFVARNSDPAGAFKQFDLTARIVCYCRHHKSPDGFKILFVLKNSKGEVLAKTVSSNIMIMDKKPTLNSNGSMVHPQHSNNTDSGLDTATEVFSAANLSEIPTATSASDNNNAMGCMDLASTPGKYFSLGEVSPPSTDFMAHGNDNSINNKSFTQSAMQRGLMPSPTSMSEEGSESYVSALDRRRASGPLGSGSAAYARNKNYQRKRPRQDGSIENGDDAGSWSGSSVGIIPSSHVITQKASLHKQFGSNDQNDEEPPSIQRVIPAQGPINGGIEITLLGRNFKDGLVVNFGENVALSTQCWSETTMVTCLPPASCAGQVFVSVANPTKGNTMETHISNQSVFTYVDDTDRQLIELALQIVGLKMNGKLEDARNIAKRIVGNDGASSSMSSPSIPSSDGPRSNQDALDTQPLYSDENLLVKVIRSLHVNSNLSMCDNLGRTLLQLASLKGYHTLCSVLIKKGARVNDRDFFGFSPLHFACVGGDTRVIRLLLQCKADATVKAYNGVSCKQLFVVNHGTVGENPQYVEEVLKIFQEYNQSSTFSRSSRKLSDSSFNSSLYDTESLESLDRSSGPLKSDKVTDECGVSDHEESELEEDGDEDLLAGDDPAAAGSRRDVRRGGIHGPDSQAMDSKLLSKMLNYLNEGLPKYEDLFPNSQQENGGKLQGPGRDVHEDPYRRTSAAEDSQTSSEDEEDALQLKLNRFFQQRQNFQNDKMLLFFWMPLTILLLSWYALFKFGQDGDYVYNFSNMVAEQLRVVLAKIVLGNERMKTAFKEQLSMFHNTNILSAND